MLLRTCEERRKLTVYKAVAFALHFHWYQPSQKEIAIPDSYNFWCLQCWSTCLTPITRESGTACTPERVRQVRASSSVVAYITLTFIDVWKKVQKLNALPVSKTGGNKCYISPAESKDRGEMLVLAQYKIMQSYDSTSCLPCCNTSLQTLCCLCWYVYVIIMCNYNIITIQFENIGMLNTCDKMFFPVLGTCHGQTSEGISINVVSCITNLWSDSH